MYHMMTHSGHLMAGSPPNVPKVFVCYRREDSEHTPRRPSMKR